MMRVLGQAFEADFRKAELALDDSVGMLSLSPDFRLLVVGRTFFISQLAMPAAFLLGKILGPRSSLSNDILLASISRITPDSRFITMQQITQDGRVMHVGGRCRHTVDQLRLAIDTGVRFHTKVPLVALASLVHLRISRSFLWFLVELGALMMVASTIVPRLTLMPFSARY